MAITRSRAEAKVSIVNKSASVATVTYTNWDDETSRSIVIPAGGYLVTRNWHEPNDEGVETALSDNIFNLQIETYVNPASPLTKVLIQYFSYDKNKVSVTITYEAVE